jgi:type II secretory pathway pseudopilin PulG
MSLMELMMVVVVLGILTSIAVPGYRKYIERSYFEASEDILLTAFAGERTYFFVNDELKYCCSPFGVADWDTIYMENPNLGPLPVAFSAKSLGCGPPPCFEAEGQRNGGPCDAKTVTYDQTHAWGGSWKACLDAL